MPLSVLKLLSHEDFRSGEEISRRLGLSRASVHNLVERARALGVDIQAVRGRGYRLAVPYSWLAPARLDAGAAALGYRLHIHDMLDSTNTHLLAAAQSGQAHASVVVAEMQTRGRGRRGREWLAPLGSSLAFSLLWRFQRPLTALSGLSLAVGVGLVRALRAMGLQAAQVKWPNDVLLGGKKLAGILIETHGDMLGAAAAVIGIGINVRADLALAERLGMPAASLEEGLGAAPDRNDVLLGVLTALAGVLSEFDAHGFKPFVLEWEAMHAWQGLPVSVTGMGRDTLEGRAAGVDESGSLRLETAVGVQQIYSGEVGLRRMGQS